LSISRFPADIAITFTSTGEDTASAARMKRNLSVPRPLCARSNPVSLLSPRRSWHTKPGAVILRLQATDFRLQEQQEELPEKIT
jgi:hypothetical protein